MTPFAQGSFTCGSIFIFGKCVFSVLDLEIFESSSPTTPKHQRNDTLFFKNQQSWDEMDLDELILAIENMTYSESM